LNNDKLDDGEAIRKRKASKGIPDVDLVRSHGNCIVSSFQLNLQLEEGWFDAL
jgi:hypothetical protein